jgi:Mg-chelatase subunit ChlD
MAKTRARKDSAGAVAFVPPASSETDLRRRRQVAHWRTLAAVFGLSESAANVEAVAGDVAQSVGLPTAVLDPYMAIDTVIQRYPELKSDFDALEGALQDDPPAGAESALTDQALRREIVYSKLLLNVFGPNTLTPSVSAEQFRQWQQECQRLGACFGHAPGAPSGGGGTPQGAGQAPSGYGGQSLTEQQLQAAMTELEGDMMKRIALREILKDDALAAQLPASMSVVEQVLLDKGNLSGNALKNAKAIIHRFVDQLAEVMRKKVERAARGRIDRSVPPKRVFRNLDLKKTIWKNLVNWDARDAKLHVNQLYYRQTGNKVLPKRLIIVVDQSGSMVDAMVQTAILGSIFATLPKVNVNLIAFDTNAVDLTAWVHDPFETLMRTNLGGGTDGRVAMAIARDLITEPRNTTMVWISDFFESAPQELFEMMKRVKESGVRFIPVGALKSGYFSVYEWFRDQLKQIGLPILSGRIEKLIDQLRDLL